MSTPSQEFQEWQQQQQSAAPPSQPPMSPTQEYQQWQQQQPQWQPQPERRQRRSSVFVPLLLIGLGGLFLAQNLGWLNISLGTILVTFWPVLLIGFGLDLIFGRGRPLVGIILGLFVAGALVLGSIFANPAASGSMQAVGFGQPLGDIRAANLTLKGDAGTVELYTLPANSSELIKGDLQSPHSNPVFDIDTNDGIADISLKVNNPQGFFWQGGAQNWDVGINPAVPYNIDLDIDAGNYDLRLGDLDLQKLYLNSDATDGSITLPDHGNVEIDLDAGALELSIPAGAAARIKVDAQASAVSVDERFQQQGSIYTTTNWDDAEQKLEITIEADAASLKIR